jgi:2-amino-4-hydroxy-6-hydroxymethyldihydropteridine diphosphokinase
LKDQINNQGETLIGIGSNINPAENIQAALDLLSKDVPILRLASIWQTPAVGSQGPDYLNTAVLINDPPELDVLKHEVISNIEHSLGRVRTQDKNADRPIDLDVLVYRGRCLDDDLWEQAHIIIPAAELLPAYLNHVTGETLSSLSGRLKKIVNFILRDDLEFSF